MNTHKAHLLFPGDAEYSEVPIKHNSRKQTQVLTQPGSHKSAIDVYRFSMPHNTLIVDKIAAAGKQLIHARIDDESGNAVFTGVISPTLSQSLTDLPGDLSIEIEDNSYLLDEDVTAQVWESMAVCDSGNTTSSILHQALLSAGYLQPAMQYITATIPTVLTCVSLEEGKGSWRSFIDTLLGEYGFVLDTDENGLFLLKPWIHDVISPVARVEETRSLAIPTTRQKRYIKDDSIDIEYSEIGTLQDVRLYAENVSFDSNGDPVGEGVLAGHYLPITSDLEEVYQKYSTKAFEPNSIIRNKDIALIHTKNHRIDWSDTKDPDDPDRGTFLTLDLAEYGPKQARVRFRNNTASTQYRYWMDIFGNAIYRKKKKNAKFPEVGKNRKSVSTKYVYDQSNAERLAKAFYNELIYGDEVFTFGTPQDLELGSIIQLVISEPTIDVRVQILSRVDDERRGHPIYTGIAISEFVPGSVLQQIEEAPIPAIENQRIEAQLIQRPTSSQVDNSISNAIIDGVVPGGTTDPVNHTPTISARAKDRTVIIDVSIPTNPRLTNFEYIEIERSAANVNGAYSRIGVAFNNIADAPPFDIDQFGNPTATQYWYRARTVTRAGTTSPWTTITDPITVTPTDAGSLTTGLAQAIQEGQDINQVMQSWGDAHGITMPEIAGGAGIESPAGAQAKAEYAAKRIYEHFTEIPDTSVISAPNSILTVADNNLIHTGDPNAGNPTDPMLFLNNLNLNGNEIPVIRIRIKRLAGTGWDGTMYWRTAAHTWVHAYRCYRPQPDWSAGWATLEYDLNNSSDPTDYLSNIIKDLRFDFGVRPDDQFEIAWIALGSRSIGTVNRPDSDTDTAISTAQSTAENHADIVSTAAEINAKTHADTAAATAEKNAITGALEQSGSNLISKGRFYDDLSRGGWNTGYVVPISGEAGINPLAGFTHALWLNTRDNYNYADGIPATDPNVTYIWSAWINTAGSVNPVNLGFRTQQGATLRNHWPTVRALDAGRQWQKVTIRLDLSTWGTGNVAGVDFDAIIPFLQVPVFENFGRNLIQDITLVKETIDGANLSKTKVVDSTGALHQFDAVLSGVTITELLAAEQIYVDNATITKLEAWLTHTEIMYAGKVKAEYVEITKQLIIGAGLLASDIGGSSLFAEFFENYSDINLFWDRWTNHTAGAGITCPVSTISQAGGRVLHVSGGTAWLIGKNLIPYDPDKLYRIICRLARKSGTGTCYLGVAGFDKDGNLCNVSGSNSHSSQHYFAATNANPGTTMTVYRGYFTGHGATSGNGLSPSQSHPGYMHPNVRYIAPLILVNYNGGTGVYEVDSFTIDILPENYQPGADVTPTDVMRDSIHMENGKIKADLLELTKSLVIGTGIAQENLIIDGDMDAPDISFWNSSSSAYKLQKEYRANQNCLVSEIPAMDNLLINKNQSSYHRIPVSEGDVLYGSIEIEAPVAGAAYLALSTSNSIPGTSNALLFPSNTKTGVRERITGKVVIPAGVTSVVPIIVINGNSTYYKQDIYFSIASLRRTPPDAMTENTYIENGKIKTDKIDTNTLVTKIFEATGTVGGAPTKTRIDNDEFSMSINNEEFFSFKFLNLLGLLIPFFSLKGGFNVKTASGKMMLLHDWLSGTHVTIGDIDDSFTGLRLDNGALYIGRKDGGTTKRDTYLLNDQLVIRGKKVVGARQPDVGQVGVNWNAPKSDAFWTQVHQSTISALNAVIDRLRNQGLIG